MNVGGSVNAPAKSASSAVRRGRLDSVMSGEEVDFNLSYFVFCQHPLFTE